MGSLATALQRVSPAAPLPLHMEMTPGRKVPPAKLYAGEREGRVGLPLRYASQLGANQNSTEVLRIETRRSHVRLMDEPAQPQNTKQPPPRGSRTLLTKFNPRTRVKHIGCTKFDHPFRPSFAAMHANSFQKQETRQLSSRKLLILLGLSTLTVDEVASYHPQFFSGHQLHRKSWFFSRSPATRFSKLYAAGITDGTNTVGSSLQEAGERTAKYDLGLGKHAPVLKTSKFVEGTVSSSKSESSSSTHQAVEFLVEHEAAMAYPSPDMVREHRERLLQAAAVSSARRTGPSVPSRSVPSTTSSPQRPALLAPFLASAKQSQEEAGPFVIDRAATSDLDMNTAWVQLLMLEQQKLATHGAN